MMDRLFAEWHCLGAPVLLAETPLAVEKRRPEALIAQSTAHFRDSGRLTWIVLAWLIDHVDDLDGSALVTATRSAGDLSVLGVLCDAADRRRPHQTFGEIMLECRPPASLEPFFTRVAASPLAVRLAHENPVDVFLRWRYLCSELQYLDRTSRQAGSSTTPCAGRRGESAGHGAARPVGSAPR